MISEPDAPSPLEDVASSGDARSSPRWRTWTTSQLIDLCSAVLLALATIATAWCGYQSSRWGGEQTTHDTNVTRAIVRAGELNNLALQKTAVHVTVYGQWLAAFDAKNTPLADFLLTRFPEPLKSATKVWLEAQPLTNASAPATPFDMPQYALAERAEADRWEAVVVAEKVASEQAGEYSDRYLVFTIVFASVLFFAGISGKFTWPAMNIAMLIMGALTFVLGLLMLSQTPIA